MLDITWKRSRGRWFLPSASTLSPSLLLGFQDIFRSRSLENPFNSLRLGETLRALCKITWNSLKKSLYCSVLIMWRIRTITISYHSSLACFCPGPKFLLGKIVFLVLKMLLVCVSTLSFVIAILLLTSLLPFIDDVKPSGSSATFLTGPSPSSTRISTFCIISFISVSSFFSFGYRIYNPNVICIVLCLQWPNMKTKFFFSIRSSQTYHVSWNYVNEQLWYDSISYHNGKRIWSTTLNRCDCITGHAVSILVFFLTRYYSTNLSRFGYHTWQKEFTRIIRQFFW